MIKHLTPKTEKEIEKLLVSELKGWGENHFNNRPHDFTPPDYYSVYVPRSHMENNSNVYYVVNYKRNRQTGEWKYDGYKKMTSSIYQPPRY